MDRWGWVITGDSIDVTGISSDISLSESASATTQYFVSDLVIAVTKSSNRLLPYSTHPKTNMAYFGETR